MLSEKEIKEYQRIHKEVYGTEISYQEAYDQGLRLINFISLLLKIEMRNNPEKYRKSKNR